MVLFIATFCTTVVSKNGASNRAPLGTRRVNNIQKKNLLRLNGEDIYEQEKLQQLELIKAEVKRKMERKANRIKLKESAAVAQQEANETDNISIGVNVDDVSTNRQTSLDNNDIANTNQKTKSLLKKILQRRMMKSDEQK